MEAFLLGRCEEDAAQKMEELLFSDDLFLQQLEEVKASLIEREVSGRLAPRLSSDLALQCARSPKLLEEVQQARDARVQALRVQSREKPSTAQPFLVAWRFGTGLAAAAVLVVMIGGVVRIRKAAEVLSVRQSATAPSPKSLEASTSALDATAGPSAAAASVLFLPSDVLRGPGSVGVLALPRRTGPVEIQVQMRGRSSDGKLWSATLFQDSRTLLQVQKVVGKAAGSVHYVSIPVPAGLLSVGQYRLTLTRLDLGTDAENMSLNRKFTLAE